MNPKLPKWQSHKIVEAARIEGIGPQGDTTTVLHLVDDSNGVKITVEVNNEYIRKHTPFVGGYYIRYQDGYASFSPAQAFAEGYTRLREAE